MPGISNITGHVKWVHVTAEPREQGFSNEVVTTSPYADLKPGSSRVKICLQNLTLKKIVIPTWCVMGQIQATNEVPEMYALVTLKGHLVMGATTPMRNENQLSPGPTQGGSENLGQFPADTKPKVPAPDRTILEQIDLLGCTSGSLEDHKEAADLLSEFADMFSQHDMDLGETSDGGA